MFADRVSALDALHPAIHAEGLDARWIGARRRVDPEEKARHLVIKKGGRAAGERHHCLDKPLV
jgi:hypothetical protein